MNNRKLVLENKMTFEGIGFGSAEEALSIITFNTAVVGYQEIISDATNASKIICMTYPLIGNYGLTDEDYESKHVKIKGLIVREYNEIPSNFRYTRTLSDVLEEEGIVGLAGIDTRNLMKIIQKDGNQKALICDIDKPIEECLEILNNYEEPTNLVKLVSSKKVWYSRTHNPIYNIGIIDLGIKRSFIKELNNLGCNVIVFPYNVTKKDLEKYHLDAILVSNGPSLLGDLDNVKELLKEYIGIVPILGMGIGANLIGEYYEVNSILAKTGNHGSNYPVRNLLTNKIELTSQNIYYFFEDIDLKMKDVTITHESVIDNTILGFKDEAKKTMAILFDPCNIIDEDSENIFKEFLSLIDLGGKNNA